MRGTRQDLLDDDFVSPAVAEVVLVRQLALRPRRDLTQGHLRRVLRFNEVLGMRSCDVAPTGLKGVQMSAHPPHGKLDDIVQAAQCDGARDLELSPD